MQKEWFNFGHFFRLLTSQPYFVWNKKSAEDWLKIEENIWDLEVLNFNQLNFGNDSPPFIEIKNRTLDFLEQKAVEFLIDWAKSRSKEWVAINRRTSIEERLEKTKKTLEKASNSLIIYPLFTFEKALSNVIAYDPASRTIVIFIPSFGTRRNNLLLIFWNIEIIERYLKTNIQRCYFLMLDYRFDLKKGEVAFILNPYCNLTQKPLTPSLDYQLRWRENCHKSGEYIDNLALRRQGQVFVRESKVNGKSRGRQVMLKALDIVREWSLPMQISPLSFADYVKSRQDQVYPPKKNEVEPTETFEQWRFAEDLYTNLELRRITENFGLQKYKKGRFNFEHFKEYLRQIELAKTETKLLPLPSLEERFFKSGYNIDTVIKKFARGWEHLSGHFLPTKTKINIIEAHHLLDNLVNLEVTSSAFNVTAFKLSTQNSNSIYYNIAEISKLVEKFRGTDRIVWFDFEAVATYYALIDNSLPFQQFISQVSIIITEKPYHTIPAKIYNLIFDPQTYTLDVCKQIIDTLYNLKADIYVVFNRYYEESRLREIVDLVWRNSTNLSQALVYRERFYFINDRIVDLQFLFKTKKIKDKEVLKIPWVFIPALGGRYSIKLVEKFLTKYQPDFVANFIKPYSELEINDGIKAMDIAIKRLNNQIKDSEWEVVKGKLAAYCENDVRSMIMVYALIEKLYASTKQTKADEDVWEEMLL